MPPTIENDLATLKRQMASLQRQVHALAELVDVLVTPFPRKVWFFILGYRWNKVGRWRYNPKEPDLH